MYKKISIAVGIFCLLFPSICLSSVIIEMENGGTFIANQTWESDSQIHFHFNGGLVSIPKQSIHSVRDSDRPYIDQTVLEKEQATAPSSPPEQDIREEEASPKEPPGAESTFDLARSKKEHKQLKAQLGISLKHLRMASRQRDAEEKERARETIREISRQIYEITDEVRTNNGELPDGWWGGVDEAL